MDDVDEIDVVAVRPRFRCYEQVYAPSGMTVRLVSSRVRVFHKRRVTVCSSKPAALALVVC